MLSAGTFGALIIGIDNLRRLTVSVAFELAGAAVAGALFIWRQRMLAYPMLAVELFARPVFALSVVSSICSFTAQNLTFVSLPFFLEEVLGRSAVETGLLMTPWPVAVALVAPIAGWLVDRHYPAGILGGIGLVALSLGLVLVAFQEAHAGVSRIAWCMAVCGVGFGFFQSPNNRTILASAPPERAGSARYSRQRAARRADPRCRARRPDLRAVKCQPRGHRPRRHLGLARRRRLRCGRCRGE